MGRLSGAPRSGWLNLAWKILLAAALLFFMSVGNPLTWAMAWGVLNPIPAILIIWGALFVCIASSNLFDDPPTIRLAWTILTLGAYLALTIPGVLIGPDRLVDALAPVAALTLVAHLGRRDLPRALRDWALVMALSLYTALGVQAMWLVVNSFPYYINNVVVPQVFLIAVLLPPLIFEAVLLLLRRVESLRDNLLAHILGLLLATSVAVVVFSLTLLNSNTQLGWRIIFGLLVGILIGGALMIGLFTQPLISAASGSRTSTNPTRGINLGRALVELSHEPILISLAIYVPLRLLSFMAAQ
jgi:hypothetical protein